MSIYNCPKGHASNEPDYCSECGTKIQGTSEVELAAKATVSTAEILINCPECTAPHEADSGEFCEICGYNFVTGNRGDLPIATAETANEATLKQNISAVETSPKTTVTLKLIAGIDPSLPTPESPPPPTNLPPLTFKLEKESNLIGRSSDRRGIYPDIALDFDDAISHRHALAIRRSDGYFLRDIGSSNGTKLNGVELQPMVDIPIKEGDEITLGHWTRIAVKAANI